MSCLSESIAQSEPDLQEMIQQIKKASSLAVLILAAFQLGRAVAVKVAQEVLNERGQEPTKWPTCGQCGQKLESKGLEKREMMTLIGQVKWRRRRGGCPAGCKIGQVVPLDEALGVEPYQKTSLEVKRLGSALAVFVPYETAAVLLEMLTGVTVWPKTIWGWVQEAGQRAMSQLDDQLQALAAGTWPQEEAREAQLDTLPLLIEADGVMAPFRPEGGSPQGKTVWREVKVGVLARLGERVTQTGKRVSQVQQRRLVAVLGNIAAFSPRLWLEAVRQGLLSSPKVVWIADGGRGFWGLFDERLAPYATGILDFYHAAQNLWQGAKCWLDGRTQSARNWFATARRRLRRGQAETVLADLQAALDLPDLPDPARHSLTTLYNYLDKHRDHIDYAKFKELGFPIGSGMVESACKWLIQQRFKGVGMRWGEDGFNHLLHLRLAWVNSRFDALFPFSLPPD